jgi:hypothetical protein
MMDSNPLLTSVLPCRHQNPSSKAGAFKFSRMLGSRLGVYYAGKARVFSFSVISVAKSRRFFHQDVFFFVMGQWWRGLSAF